MREAPYIKALLKVRVDSRQALVSVMLYYMAKTFNNLKTKLGLLDFISIGKYKGCRVDSIIEQDYEYLIYMDKEKILQFAPEVIDKLKNLFSATSIEVEYDEEADAAMLDAYNNINGNILEDIPF